MAGRDLRKRIGAGSFILDGGMGTQLIARGVELGRCNDYLNIESAEIISQIHADYLNAGSDAVISNTFGANAYALKRHGLSDRAAEINRTGARIAREVAGDERYVLGDMGPTGDFLAPLGLLNPDELRDAFAEQARALVEGGVDGLIIETMTALDELEIAVEAAKSASEGVPVFASMAFDAAGEDFKTMMGVSATAAVERLASLGVEGVGFNCGTVSLEQYVALAERFVEASPEGLAVYAEPNAGKPELVDGEARYVVGPEDFAAAIERIHAAGVSIVGGCCGTTPEHIRAVAGRLRP